MSAPRRRTSSDVGHLRHLRGEAADCASSAATSASTTVPSKNAGFWRVKNSHRVGEHEVAEVAFVDPLVVDHLPRLFEHLGHVGDVPVREVGAEHRPEARAARVELGVERARGERVVGLAAEEEAAHEAGRGCRARSSIPHAAHSSSVAGSLGRRAPRGRVDELVLAALPYCASSSLSSSWSTPFGSRWSSALPVALLPVPDDVGVERDAPRHAALEEPNCRSGKRRVTPPMNSDFASACWPSGEVAEVVVHVVRDRRAAPPPDRARVERHADAEVLALRPHRVVVVRAVDAVHVDPLRVLRELGITVGDRGDRALHVAREQHRLEAELAHRVLELGDRLVGRVHRDRRHRHHAGRRAWRTRRRWRGSARGTRRAAPARRRSA